MREKGRWWGRSGDDDDDDDDGKMDEPSRAGAPGDVEGFSRIEDGVGKGEVGIMWTFFFFFNISCDTLCR